MPSFTCVNAEPKLLMPAPKKNPIGVPSAFDTVLSERLSGAVFGIFFELRTEIVLESEIESATSDSKIPIEVSMLKRPVIFFSLMRQTDW